MYDLCVHRYILAAKEVNYAYKVLNYDGQTLESTRSWKYVFQNGKEFLYQAYAVSLDLYVLFCWDQLGGLATLLTGLLVAEVSLGRSLMCIAAELLAGFSVCWAAQPGV